MTTNTLASYLDIAKTAVQDAATFIRNVIETHRPVDVYEKEGGELVTNVDIDVERRIRARIREAFPGHGILGEEEGRSDSASSFCWYIDPIDGTGNFSQGNPHYAVSVALAQGKNVLVGVIAQPATRTLFHAIAGGDAFRNGVRIRVNADTDLFQSRVLWCEGHTTEERQASRLQEILRTRVKTCERLGSAALECALVASGEAAAFATTGIRSWDVAAGVLLTTEAGGSASTFTGEPYLLETSNLLVSNGRMHTDLVRLLSELEQ